MTNHIYFCKSDNKQCAVIMQSNKENFFCYINSLGCFKDKIISNRSANDEENSIINRSQDDPSVRFDIREKLAKMLNVNFVYLESDVLTRQVANKLYEGEFIFANNVNII
jgi:hypothetical protein